MLVFGGVNRSEVAPTEMGVILAVAVIRERRHLLSLPRRS